LCGSNCEHNIVAK